MATLNAIMTNVMTNPDVAVVGILIGFILAKAMNRRRRSGFGGGF
jgi:hypothetical protein